MQSAYLEWASPDDARHILSTHRDYYTEQVELLTAVRDGIANRTDPAKHRRLDARPASENTQIIAYKVFCYSGMIARSRSEVEWAIAGLHLIVELQGTLVSDITS